MTYDLILNFYFLFFNKVQLTQDNSFNKRLEKPPILLLTYNNANKANPIISM